VQLRARIVLALLKNAFKIQFASLVSKKMRLRDPSFSKWISRLEEEDQQCVMAEAKKCNARDWLTWLRMELEGCVDQIAWIEEEIEVMRGSGLMLKVDAKEEGVKDQKIKSHELTNVRRRRLEDCEKQNDAVTQKLEMSNSSSQSGPTGADKCIDGGAEVLEKIELRSSVGKDDEQEEDDSSHADQDFKQGLRVE
jgi:hypothetical protein